jgi:hypothetical protein
VRAGLAQRLEQEGDPGADPLVGRVEVLDRLTDAGPFDRAPGDESVHPQFGPARAEDEPADIADPPPNVPSVHQEVTPPGVAIAP